MVVCLVTPASNGGVSHGFISVVNTSSSHNCTMSFETQMHLLLLSELVSALRANDSETFRRWLSGGIQDLGRPVVEELMLEWMNPLLTVDEMDRLVGWHLGVSI